MLGVGDQVVFIFARGGACKRESCDVVRAESILALIEVVIYLKLRRRCDAVNTSDHYRAGLSWRSCYVIGARVWGPREVWLRLGKDQRCMCMGSMGELPPAVFCMK